MTPSRRASAAKVARVSAAALACSLLPSRADAHLVTTGLGPIYDGISHMLMSPEDLVPVLAIALLAGLNGPVAGRRTLFVLTAAWTIGGVAGYLAGQAHLSPVATSASFLLFGALAAADRRLSPTVVAVLAAAMGLLHGWLNGAGIAQAQREALGLVGIGTVVFVLVALVSALAVSLRSGWARIVLRVAGSWVAAIGLLMLGWGLRS